MSLGGGGGGSTSGTSELRYAPYIEAVHARFLGVMEGNANTAIYNSPYKQYSPIILDDAFFGIGKTITTFPSLYDMYGKFIGGVNINTLYNKLYEETVNSPITDELIAAESRLLDDEIITKIYPRFQSGMRDINSVMSSSFATGASLIEDAKIKALAKFSSELKYKLIPLAQDRWIKYLEWNKNTVMSYAEIMKLYYVAKCDIDDQNYGMQEKHELWPFTVLDFERAGLGALQGAMTTKNTPKGSKLAGALSGAASGAMAGTMVLPGWGTSIGAIIGGIGGMMG